MLTKKNCSPRFFLANSGFATKPEIDIISVFSSIGTKAELGAAVGIKSTTAIAVIDAGSAKKELEALSKDSKKEKAPAKEEKAEEVKEEKAEE